MSMFMNADIITRGAYVGVGSYKHAIWIRRKDGTIIIKPMPDLCKVYQARHTNEAKTRLKVRRFSYGACNVKRPFICQWHFPGEKISSHFTEKNMPAS